MVEFRHLREEELESWFDHCAEVFTGTPREYFVSHWNNDPWRDLNSIFIAVHDDKILSTVRIFHREVFINGEKIKMGGIGEVSTKAEARKRGLSTELLKKSIEYMVEKGIHISILFGSELNYSRLGWKSIDASLNHSSVKEQKGLYSIREVNFTKDSRALMDIYEKYNNDFNGAVVRDDELYWSNWVKVEWRNCFVAETSDGDIVGYMAAETGEDVLVVKDYAVIIECPNVFEELAYYACNKLGKTGGIKYPSVINSTLRMKEQEKIMYNMVRLNSPFKVDERIIENTETLISILNSEEKSNNNSKYNFWFVDSF